VRLLDLVKIINTTIASLPKVFICIDGLDECLLKNRKEPLESLQGSGSASLTRWVLFSGRPHLRARLGNI